MSNKLRLTILAAISIIVGMLSFSHFKYAPPTLVIDMRTSKGGYGQVYWNTGDGYSETNSRKFPLKSSEGFEVYKIPLPSETLTAVRIDPMVSTGTFEIRKIMVEGSGLSSEWSGKNLVRDLVALQNVEYRTDTPSGILEGTATTNDPSIEIRGFPADILERATATRLKRSLLIVLCFLIMAFLYQNRQAIGKLLSKIPRREAITLKISRFADFAITNIFPFLMSIYLLSFWIPPRSLDGQNEIDGSWNYALGKFRQLNLSFGKDSWFTYGPVSQWFGPALPPHNFYPWPFYVLAIFIGLLFFVSLRRIVKYSDTRVFAKTVAAILFSVSLVLTLRNPYEASLEVTTVLTFTAGFLLEGRVSWWLFPLMMLSSVGLLFKFSVGVLASVCFFIVLFYSFLSHCITLKRVLALLVAFLCLTELLFFFS